MTLSREEEMQTTRSSKMPRLEHLQLHNLIMDEPPSLDISNTGMGLHALRVTFDSFNIAVALCEGAHLATLKGYSMKFMSFMTMRYEAETGLRTPTITEAQSADKTIHGIIADLISDKSWTPDQALHEMTHMRSELSTLLQARPRLPKAPTWTPTFVKGGRQDAKGLGKGPGKGKKGSTKGGKNRVVWVTEANVNGTKRQLCIRYQTGACTLCDNCRFHHGCAFPKPDGSACNGQHGARDHESTPH